MAAWNLGNSIFGACCFVRACAGSEARESGDLGGWVELVVFFLVDRRVVWCVARGVMNGDALRIRRRMS